MILYEYDTSGGIGGEGGKKGKGGKNGKGGKGGASFSWTEIERQPDGSAGTVKHSNPRGKDGRSGADGRDGHKGQNGRNGQSGHFSINVEKNANILTYPGKYILKVNDFNILDSDDGIYEPGEDAFVNNLTVINTGNMPTPGSQDIVASLANDRLVNFNYTDVLPFNREIPKGARDTLNRDLKFTFAQFPSPSREGIPIDSLTIRPICTVTRVNKDFGQTPTKSIQVSWSVEWSVPIAVKTISRLEEAPFAIEVRNISRLEVGKNSTHPRKLILKIEQIDLFDNDIEHLDIAISKKDKIVFFDEDGTENNFNTTKIIREISILERDSFKFCCSFFFADPETPPYTKIRIKSSLHLGGRDMSTPKLIQYRTFDLQLSEIFFF